MINYGLFSGAGNHRLEVPKYPCRHLCRGSSTVELVFTIGFFVTILISSIIGGFLMYSYIATDYLAREGMQFAIKRGSMMADDPLRPDDYATEAGIRTFLTDRLLSPITVSACWLSEPDAACESVVNGVNNKPGMSVRVTVSHDFHVPLISSAWPRTVTLTSTAQGTIIF